MGLSCQCPKNMLAINTATTKKPHNFYENKSKLENITKQKIK